MSWQINPFKSVGLIAFGETRERVREALGSDCSSFRKAEGENVTDAYDSLGIHIYYDNNDQVELVEMFEPAQPLFAGVSLIGQAIADVVRKLRELGYEGDQDDIGYNYDPIGIGLTVNEEVIEGIAVFKDGYYV